MRLEEARQAKNDRKNTKKSAIQLKKEKLIIIETKYKLEKYKQMNGCCKCNERRPYLLQFHHIDETKKSLNIGSSYARGYDKLMAEIDGSNGSGGCIVVCSNCHDEIEYLKRRDVENSKLFELLTPWESVEYAHLFYK